VFRKTAVFALIMGLLFTSSAYAYNVQLKPFKDETYDYARESIYALSALGIVAGYPDGTYRPDDALSREAFIKLLVSAAKIDTESGGRQLPSDVAGDRWSAPYVAAALERHWLGGLMDSTGKLHPGQTITRQEVATVIGTYLLASESQAARDKWLSEDWLQERDARAFPDRASMTAELQPYLYYAVHRGMMAGEPDGFKPLEPLTRKQAAAVIYRLIDRQIEAQSIDFTGFYAIQSYGAIDQIDKLSNVIFGWSRLSYESEGSARLDTETSEYRIPRGYEEAIAAADEAQAGKELMVFYDGADLKSFLKDMPARRAFIDSLMETMEDKSYGFTGVCIDFEGLKDADSAVDLTAFLQELKKRLGTRTLSAAVPPSYYYGGYDLKEIGRIADTVILMAYDFTHHESKLPSAPLPLVNDTVQQALVAVPKEKLVLGISKQANQWITSTEGGAAAPPVSPAIADVEKRIGMPGVVQTRILPYFLDLITFQDDRGSHEIYYENSQSIADKIRLAKFYGLKGVSLWYMGNYTQADWALIGQQAG